MFGKINLLPNNSSQTQSTSPPAFQNRVKDFPHKSKPIAKLPKPNNVYQPKDTSSAINNKKQKRNQTAMKIEKQSLRAQLQGPKFRLLNEFMYTNDSHKAIEHFIKNQEDFETYHEGFKSQALKWEINPLDVIIGYITKNYLKAKKTNKSKKWIVDMGCGEGRLYEDLMNKQKQLNKNILRIKSFDLVASKPHIEVADIAHLPVQENSVDACVFCLSLMGTNYLDFLIEARRILKKDGQNPGQLLIAQVQSRSTQWKSFVAMIQSLGFICFKNQTISSQKEQQEKQKTQKKAHEQKNNDFFRLMYFRIDNSQQFQEVTMETIQQSKKILGGCLYKRR